MSLAGNKTSPEFRIYNQGDMSRAEQEWIFDPILTASILVARLRKIDIAETERTVIISEGTQTKSGSVVSDAGSALRAQRAKKTNFDHNPFSTRIKDLV